MKMVNAWENNDRIFQKYLGEYGKKYRVLTLNMIKVQIVEIF